MKRNLLLLALLLLAFASCDRNKVQDEPEYDREALLTQLGEQLILPRYQALALRGDDLAAALGDFQTSTDQISLDALRQALRELWLQWERCSPLEFGPAADRSLRASVNTFPVDTFQVYQNISAGTWDLASASNIDAKGLPATAFLLYDGTDAEVLQRFSDANRMAYLQALVSELQTLFGQVATVWEGSYLADFKASTGTDVGSSTSLVVNQLNYDLEQLKHARIGIPLGKQTMGTALPGHVESAYNDWSMDLAAAQLSGLEDLFRGQPEGGGAEGYAFDDILATLEVSYNGGSLATAIRDQFAAVRTAMAAVDTPLQEAVLNDANTVDALWNEVQRLVVLLKTDMASALGVLITYTDNDGD